ncbi:ArsR family transcriptional regulator [Methanoplanus sp. FWC-SCC4]|uniref:ArsR family transcriptional regulator n=1 Tax=Methanochimaera problematica TaxID=2609417 RepID=A0AA97F9R9_9EURY|nr:flavodoxin [Methanoplanus sp. FWC-SCC4]WOF15172.1 ArsR family transcriptional regulator [Methanoplanus sp. FWC-SCC4]
MKPSIIFYSYTGITCGIAEKIQDETGGELVEVKTKEPYSKITAYTLGCFRARRGECDKIEQESIDVSDSDILVIGTPVWAFRATPAINAAVEALKGCDGKTAVLFATCGGQAGDTLPELTKALTAKGVRVKGEFLFDRNDVRDQGRINALIAAVKTAGDSK